MPDIIGSGDWGRDDGIKCEWIEPDGSQGGCGDKTYLVDDQGQGLCAYKCEGCGGEFQVQFDSDDDDLDLEGYPPYWTG